MRKRVYKRRSESGGGRRGPRNARSRLKFELYDRRIRRGNKLAFVLGQNNSAAIIHGAGLTAFYYDGNIINGYYTFARGISHSLSYFVPTRRKRKRNGRTSSSSARSRDGSAAMITDCKLDLLTNARI